jgi:hypothetical protein
MPLARLVEAFLVSDCRFQVVFQQVFQRSICVIAEGYTVRQLKTILLR